jgi:signal transduction histidine kinase
MACERQVSLAIQTDGETPYAGDEELLRRLLLNVVRNAVQHTRAGGRVDIAVRRQSNQISIEVRDQGPGIAAGDRDRIFERFVQIDNSRRHDGAGLGLPIARWIAELHGGRLDLAESSPSGSTFVVVLPRVHDGTKIERVLS